MKISSLKTDLIAIGQGQWIDNIPEMEDLRLKVRGIGNVDYRRAFDAKVASVPAAKKIRGLDPAERDRIVGECLVETVLLDWDGLTDDAGQARPFSVEAARPFLTDPAFARFRAAVIWAASVVADEANFGMRDDAGNS